jgi:hypothetical protein
VSPSHWRLDVQHWPGPDRARWGISRDVVAPSPDGRFACVLYSCCEIRIGCEAGLLTLLEGPPQTPTVLLQPPRFTCLDCSPRSSAQWLAGGKVVVVTSYLYRTERNQVDLLAFTFLDPVNRAFAHQEIPLAFAGCSFTENGDDWLVSVSDDEMKQHELRVTTRTLKWENWKRLR